MEQLKAMELFCGAGGLGLGLQQAGFSVVLANELESDFAATYQENHPQTRVLCEDISRVDFRAALDELGIDHLDLLSGGPPCQGFSTVGAKNPDDPRNRLFREFLRAVRHTNPRFVLFENVAGFMRLYDGRDYQALVKELTELGYRVTAAVLDASDYGLPQYRKRTIVVGWKNGEQPVTFPEPTHRESEDLFGGKCKLNIMDAISDLPVLKAGESAIHYASMPQNAYQADLRKGLSELTEHSASAYGAKMRRILELVPPGGSVDDLPEELRPKNYFKNTYARLLPDRPAPTITRNFGTPSSSRCIHPYQNRALSTREGARLQGFPDSYRFVGSKTSKNLQIGNAVPPLLGKVIGESIIKAAIKQNKSTSLNDWSKRKVS